MPKILIPLADGFEEIEALATTDILRRAGIEVSLAGLRTGQVISARNLNIIPDISIDAVKIDEFDMIILPGGQPGTNNLDADKRIKKLLKEFNSANKLIGAICAATTILANAGIINGRQVTSYPSYSSQLDGAKYEDKTVVTDGNIITSQGPGTAIEFALVIVSRLSGRHTAEKIEEEMLVKNESRSEQLWNQYLFNNTLQSLLSAVELTDAYAQGHARRVTEYALNIGAKLNLSKEEMRDLYLGSMLHDIGKIATEKDLLNKADRLNRSEETIIREHPLKGTLFIVGIDNLNNIVPTILHHHERWDGTGYPAKLKGDQIPLHARIVNISDSFDAMLHNRSFRPGLDRESAVKELQKQKGLQFDPFMVDILIDCLNESPYEMKDFSYYF
jgi:4-methyl-5(b-hydroxyethyl)-thiazole monophosphate biosynthesis